MHKTHFLSRAMLLVFFVVGSLAGMAQVSLTATSGTVTGTYTTLKGAFDKINDGTHKGVIVLKITGTTTGNDNNTIDNNDVTNIADASRPLNAVYALGTSKKLIGLMGCSGITLWNTLPTQSPFRSFATSP